MNSHKPQSSRLPGDDELLRLVESGMSFSKIGRMFNVTKGVVSSRMYRINHKDKTETSPNSETVVPPKKGTTIEEDKNKLVLESVDGRVTSLDELLTRCKVDQNIWKVKNYVVNTWEVGINSGDGVEVETLYQVKAWLVRAEPIPISPVIAPIQVNINGLPIHRIKRGDQKLALILPDPHFGFSRNIRTGELTPFHNREALSIALRMVQMLEPDVTVWLGDVMDYSGWSEKFIQRPEFYFTTQPALIEASWNIGQTKKYSEKVYVLEGNHDIRPENAIIKHLMNVYDLYPGDQVNGDSVLSINNLLGLERMGVIAVGNYPEGEVYLNSTTKCIHGEIARKGNGVTSKTVVQEIQENVIFGHIHRIEMISKTLRLEGKSRIVSAMSPGCLCYIDGRVPSASKLYFQWQNGIGLVWYNDDYSQLIPIPIQDNHILYSGIDVESFDYLPTLIQESGYKSF